MRTIPSAEELLDIVAQFLRTESADPGTSNQAYYLRVAANAIDIVRREVHLGAAADERARLRLRQLLPGCDGDLAALEARLAQAIRAGSLSTTSPELLEHLWHSALAEVAIDQPGYATFQRLTTGTAQ